MSTTRQYQRRAGPRDVLYFTRPDLWPWRPFLPVERISADGSSELGVMYDALHSSGTYGLSATVFITNLLDMPRTEADFLALPHYSYDTPEELADDGWFVD